jgi:hypothetical protein
MMRILPSILIVLILMTAVLRGQGATAPQAPATPPPAGRGAGPAGAQAPAPAPVEPLAPQGFTYNPEGRRDPFVSLVRRGSEIGAVAGERPPGLAGMTAAEIVLKGTFRGQSGAWVAMVQGTDNKTYMVAAGDRLLDGTVRTITADTMVILQRVNDPLSLDTTREVRKVLRQTEEAK